MLDGFVIHHNDFKAKYLRLRFESRSLVYFAQTNQLV